MRESPGGVLLQLPVSARNGGLVRALDETGRFRIAEVEPEDTEDRRGMGLKHVVVQRLGKLERNPSMLLGPAQAVGQPSEGSKTAMYYRPECGEGRGFIEGFAEQRHDAIERLAELGKENQSFSARDAATGARSRTSSAIVRARTTAPASK